ncbi:MAG: hypothetical protein ABGY28_04855, partial [bacterium]
MKKIAVVLSIARVLVTAALASAVVFSAAEAGAAQVQLNGVPSSAAPGTAFTAELVVDTGSASIPLGSYSATISWSPDLLSAGTCVGGTTLEFSGAPFVNTGTAQVAVAGFNLMSLASPGGGVSVAEIPFTITGGAAGQTIDLSFSNVVVSDTNGAAIPVNTLGASIVLGAECGNGIVEAGETCDDGNNIAGDCCAADCTAEVSACNDASVCTTDDACSAAGVCEGTALDCSDGNVCTDNICDPISGCLNLTNNAACSDGDPCTSGDQCAVGVCVSGGPTTCDDSNACTTDSCAAAVGCQFVPGLVDCNDDNGCTDDICDPLSGCVKSDNSLSCDDGSACTTNDTCTAGSCVGGLPPGCDDSNNCTLDSCDDVAGCVNAALADGNACLDGDVCNGAETCQGGSCSGGSAMDCDDQNSCTGDSCDSLSGCANVSVGDGTNCNDGDACTTADTCSAGSCVGGAAPDCNDSDLCTADSCDSASGCANTDISADCTDANGCTTDSCDSASGCTHANNTNPCDDGDACTTGDVCAAGACGGVDTSVADCDDVNGCTDDSCDAANGCVNAANSLACDDGNACTQSDSCSAGICQAGAPVVCNDGDVCTDDQCNEADGSCSSSGNTGPACDDGNPCTTDDSCQSGTCVGGAATDCGDGNVCTDDVCNSASGCSNPANVATCDDGLFCNGDDVCAAGACGHAGDPCAAGATCNNSCNETAGNCLNPAATSCTANPDTCTLEQCDGLGSCVPAPTGIENAGPVNPDNGFPGYYIDTAGIALELCLQPGACFDPQLDLPDPSAPVSFPANFPEEAFWWMGEAVLATPAGGQLRLSMALEGTFGGGVVSDGDQIAFTRVRIKGTGLSPFASYVMSHPYGTETVVADGLGEVNFTEDIDIFGLAAVAPGDGGIGPFLVWDDGTAPLGTIGSPLVAHTVTGSPCNQNYFRVDGPGLGTASLETDLFSVLGHTVDPCGNGFVDYGEQCDDGNTLNGDCCTSSCGLVAAATACTDHDVCTDNGVCDGLGATCPVASFTVAPCDDGDACTTTDTCAAGTCVGGIAPVCDDELFCTGVESCDSVLGCVDNADPVADDNVACTDDSCDEVNDVIVNAVNDAFCDDTLFCTGVETCDATLDCQDNADPLADDGVGCTDDSCDEINDEIVNAINHGSCDDNLYCTGVESCDALTGCQDNTDPDPNDGVACTVDTCDEVTDSLVNTINHGACDDGEFCTGVESCDAALGCQDNADPVVDDSVACTDDSCDEVNDVIVNAANDALCDDTLFCTGVETCDATLGCQDNADPDPNDGVLCTVDTCDEATNSLVNTVDDAACDDGEFCTGVESCDATLDCQDNADPLADDGVGCTDDSCDELNDLIVNAVNDGNCEDGNLCTSDSCDAVSDCLNANNTLACDDGNACTTTDTCSAGACDGVDTSVVDCDDGNLCTDDSCDVAAGCVNGDNVLACDDGNACTTADTCAASSCLGGIAPDCDDANGCTDDFCNSIDGCINASNVALCDDSDACTTLDTCSGGSCVGGVAPVCDDGFFCTGVESCDTALGCQDNADPNADDGVACTDDSCDEINDVIVNAVNDGLCDDLQFCTGVETCDATLGCQDNADPLADDGVACTDDSCDEVHDVIVNAVNDALCDDGLYCTGVETCDAAADCQDNVDPLADDGVFCTDDSCDELNDVIVNAVNDGNCDDGLYCTGVETCDAAADCQDNADPVADDGVFCTDDSCDELNDVIVNAVNDANCNDGLYCTGVETCDAAADCQDNADPVADDGVACTDDSCDEVHDVIVNAVNDANCNDGLYCTGVETCDAAADCQDNADPNADDGVFCTDDSCDELNDVIVNAVNDGNCDDGQFCTGVETCHATMDCQNNADPNADDGVACTDDSCDEVADVIVNAVNDSNCGDGLYCTGVETCHATMDCQDNADPSADDGVACTDDSCDEINDVIVN